MNLDRRTIGFWLIAVLVTTSCGDDTQNPASGGAGGGTSDGASNAGGSPIGPGAGASGPGAGGSPPIACASGPLGAPIQGCTPTPLASTGDPHQDCVDRINQFRYECQCLPPLARWTDAENCSDQQSGDDQADNAPHGHFGACGESAQNSCPNWPSEENVVSSCLQGMWDEGPGEPFLEHGHYINMSNTGYSKVACGFASGAAGVWANQNFSN